MKNMKKMLAMGLIAGLLLVLSPAAASAAVLQVGPGKTYSTIQAAVDAANPGDKILVHPGTYNEQVNVGKTVTLSGTGWPVVNGQPTAFWITGAGATVEGFDVRGKQTTYDSGNDVIAVKADNVTVQKNRVTGTGPYIDWRDRNPGPGISAILTDGVVIKGNWIRNTSGAGIWFGSSTNGTIRDNDIDETQYTGILLPPWSGNPPSHDNVIKNNKVIGTGSSWVCDDGIRLGAGAYNNAVHDNRVTVSNASGIRAVGKAHDNTIENNVMRDNDASATDTCTGYDAYDQSSGSGTGGTANTWQHNTFDTAFPAGLE